MISFFQTPYETALTQQISVPSTSRQSHATPNQISRVRFPSSVLIKNSRITPIYEEIPELVSHEIPRNFSQSIVKRTAWEQQPLKNSEERNVPVYEEIPDVWNDSVRIPTNRQTKQFTIIGNLSPEEEVLDRTVQWAMDNFVFSETGATFLKYLFTLHNSNLVSCNEI